MTRDFLKMVRAQAATTAYRDALELVRKLPAKEAESQLLQRIAGKRPVLDEWRRKQEKKKATSAEQEYRDQAAIMDQD